MFYTHAPPVFSILTFSIYPLGDNGLSYEFGEFYTYACRTHPLFKRNPSRSYNWYLLGSNRDHTPSMIKAALCSCWGYGIEKDYLQAKVLLHAAANRGDAQAMRLVGWLYDGHDDPMALYWYKKAADHGSGQACTWLSSAYENGGLGVVKDMEESKKWLLRGVERKCPIAFNNYGCDLKAWNRHEEALNYYHQSEQMGEHQAMYCLGDYYEGKKEYDEAIKWYKKCIDWEDPLFPDKCAVEQSKTNLIRVTEERFKPHVRTLIDFYTSMGITNTSERLAQLLK